MAKQSVLGSPDYNGSTGHRTGFSMSQDYTFTAGLGMLLPAYKQFLNIGEHVNGIPRLFVRTEPFLAPAMADIDVYCDVFFVPMRHLISMFDDWYTQVDDAKSSLWDTTVWKEHLPVLSATDAQDRPNPFAWMDQVTFNTMQHGSRDTGQIVNYGFGVHRLTQMLGYNAQSLFSSYSAQGWSDDQSNVLPEFAYYANNLQENPFTPYYHMAYQKIYYDYYRDSNFEPNFVKAYNLDAAMNAGLSSFNPKANISVCDERMFALRYRQRSKDYFQAVHPSPLFNGMGMLPNAKSNLMRVKNWLTDQNPVFLDATNSLELSGFSSAPDVELVGTNPFQSEIDSSWSGSSQTPKYLGIVNNSSPYTVNGDGTTVSGGGSTVHHKHNIDVEKLVSDQALVVETQGGESDSGIALAQIRAAFAMDKLLRVTNRAGKHVDDQMFAQFGVKIPQGVSGEVYKIKSYHTMIHIGEVIQSATTVDSSGNDVPLGELAGRGVAELNTNNIKDKFDFTAPCHGIMMCIVSFAPRYKYIFTREKDGYKVYLEDFFRPAYDNLGMQPTEFFEYGNWDADKTVTPVWQYRFMEDKIKHDRTSYVFATVSKNPWSFVHRAELPSVNYSSGKVYGFAWQKVMPFDSNNLFVVQFNGNPQFPQDVASNPYKNPTQFLSAYLTDPFTVDFSMQCTKVSQMSTYGEPSLGGL